MSTFWITHPNNELSNNAAAGGEVGLTVGVVVGDGIAWCGLTPSCLRRGGVSSVGRASD